MILSVVIVNFNVKYFLEQCLHSIKKAIGQSALLQGKTEVFIVDNASSDGSIAFLEPLYPGFRFISNTENKGFAKSNNQALADCSGKYILFLNPDTVLAEDSLDQCLSFFEAHPNAGAVGVRMIDGCGRFLKESKRGFPTATASFFKMSKLAAVFPSSRFFAAYYAGHLDPTSNHPVEILSGAFMMVRKDVLDLTGGFDEQFFMYAEDIDLCYRISKAGFQNYYLASTTIIHFKGESTPRDIRYVHQFYLAMKQFMKKHFHGSSSSLLLYFLNLGVALRQRLAAAAVAFQKKSIPAAYAGPVFIKVAPENLSEVKEALQHSGIGITDKENTAGEWLFFEGGDNSLKCIIREMDKASRRISCFIHGSGTHAAVGDGPGGIKTILLPVS
ncbi:MAG: glycosyltransferase family 2 protein [Bacteroidota bacterium]|nr:glycosyltransferase family 2 protein [Bacteroidota bacterium]